MIDFERPWKKCKTWLVNESGLSGRNCSSFGCRHVGCGVLSFSHSPSLPILFLRSRIDGRHPFGVKLRPCPGLRTRKGDLKGCQESRAETGRSGFEYFYWARKNGMVWFVSAWLASAETNYKWRNIKRISFVGRRLATPT